MLHNFDALLQYKAILNATYICRIATTPNTTYSSAKNRNSITKKNNIKATNFNRTLILPSTRSN